MEGTELTAAASSKQGLIRDLEQKSGVTLTDCYQCGKCSAGCPVAFSMDITPRRIIRNLQLGLLDNPLKSRTVWLCASCQTCVTRCPRNVDLPALMEALRQTAKQKGICPESDINLFSDLFLQSVKTFGRVHEMLLMLMYNLRSGHLFQDVMSSPHLLLTGKIHIMPDKIKDTDAVKRIFQKCLERGKHS